MKRYKMRAECVMDVGNAIVHLAEGGMLGAVSITACGALGGDVEATFGYNGDVAALRARLSDVQDGHVMAETVALAKEYTGERGDFCYLCGAPSLYPADARCEQCRDSVRAAMRNQHEINQLLDK